MDSIIDKNDKIWKMFLNYSALIGSQARDEGLDLYGADQKTALAKDLVVAHLLNDIVCALKDMNEQSATFERSRYHLKPQTIINVAEPTREESNA